MPYDPSVHHRRSIRLRGYDYRRPGLYAVTIVVKGREINFGEIVDDAMQANEAGRIAVAVWAELPAHFPCVDTDAFVLMPNHVHGIIVIGEPPAPVGAGSPRPVPPADVGAGSPRPTESPRPTPTPAVDDGRGGETPPQHAGIPRAADPLSCPRGSGIHSQAESAANGSEGGETAPLPVFVGRPTLGQIVAYFKYQSAARINALWGTAGRPLWQRNYYEHIICNERQLERMRRYIDENPERWELDHENPAHGAAKVPG